MGRLTGKVAIVTGAARGMGRATAELFAAEGAEVVACDVSISDADAAQPAQGILFRTLDVSDEAAWEALVAECVERFGRIDILVNNAGILIVEELLKMPVASVERTFAVNLIGPFLGMKHAGAVMAKAGKGSIINISSSGGLQANNGMTAYGTSKWGLRGLSKIAAMELGLKGIRVNSVHPGPVNTPMVNPDGATSEQINGLSIFDGLPLRRVGEPEEIARASLFLASDDSSYVNGAELAVDGGMVAGKYLEFQPGGPDAR